MKNAGRAPVAPALVFYEDYSIGGGGSRGYYSGAQKRDQMKRFSPIWTASLALVLCITQAHSAQAQVQDRLTINSQIRERTEFSAKDFNADVDNPSFSLLRTRLNVGIEAADDIDVFVQFQDSRVFGGAGGTISGSAPALDAHQAYFRVSNFFDSDVSVKVGRQEIVIGNQRLIGSVGWSNVGRNFDAARISLNTETGSFEFIAANIIGDTGTTNGDNLYGIVGSYPYADGSRVEALVLYDNRTNEITGGSDEGEAMLSRITAGAAAYGQVSGFDYELEAYLQTGDAFEAATGELGSIGAYLASAKVGYTLNPDNGLRIGGLFTLVSGDEDAGDGDIGNFNTLFATNHKFYGFMDYFVGAGSFARGLQDVALSASVRPKDKLKLAVDVHNFTSVETPDGADSLFGQEIDVTATYTYNSAMSIVAGVSAFLPGDDFAGSDADNAYWGYLSMVVNF